MNITGGIDKNDIRQYGSIQLVRQMRAEADAGIERLVYVQLNWNAELVHRFTVHADEKCKIIAAFFNANTLGVSDNKIVR